MKRSQAQSKLKHSSKTAQAFHDQGETDFFRLKQNTGIYAGNKEENLNAAFGSLSLEINTKVQPVTSAKESAAGSYSMLPMNEKIYKKPNTSKTALS